ncbi:MAG: SDR family oxidoreductase [Myxococcota bacterium]
MTRLQGKVVWVTGASSGIGEALVHALAGEGCQVALSARRDGELARVARDVGEAVSTLVAPMDVTDDTSRKTAHAKVMKHFGRVDVLINNAGVSQRGRAVDTSVEVLRRLMEVDFFGPVELTRLVLPEMLERKSGHVVVVTSLLGVFGTPWRSGYAAAKHAMHGWSESLRAEVADQGVNVTVACPGFVRTGISAHALTPDGSPLGKSDRDPQSGITPEACARGILKAIRRNAVEVYVARAPEKLAGFVKRASPATFARLIRRVRVT